MRHAPDVRFQAFWKAMPTVWNWPTAGVDAIRPSGRCIAHSCPRGANVSYSHLFLPKLHTDLEPGKAAVAESCHEQCGRLCLWCVQLPML
jgi:hypothetical protein